MKKLSAVIGLSLLMGCGPKAPPAPVVPAASMPEVGALPQWQPPVPSVVTLDNGAQLWVLEDHGLPLVSVDLILPGGSVDDPPGKWGLAELTGAMMEESAGGLSSSEIAQGLKLLAATLSVGVEAEAVVVSLDVSKGRLGGALPFMASAVTAPDLLESDWERVQTLHVNELKNAREEPASVAREIAYLELMGGGHPLGHPAGGTPEMTASITLEDVQGYHRAFATPMGATFVVAGDVTVEEAKAALTQAFAGWTGEAHARPDLPEIPPMSGDEPGPRLVIVDMPGSSQTAIRAMGPGFKAGHADEPAATLAGIVIGGSFTSRLNNLLREQKGYTYGARAGFYEWSALGAFVASSNVRIDATAAALLDTLMVLRSAGGEFTPGEVEKAHAQHLTAVIGPMETRSGVAGAFANRAIRGEGPTGWADALATTLATDGAAMSAAAQRYINPDAFIVVLAGDRSVIEGPLEEAGFRFDIVTPVP